VLHINDSNLVRGPVLFVTGRGNRAFVRDSAGKGIFSAGRISWLSSHPAVRNPIPFLRRVALAEGISFLVLLGIAMPLKYLAGMPGAVKVFGWAHGVLFIVFCVALLRVWITAKWPILRCAAVFVAALLPFGPFVIDRRMTEWEAELLEGRPLPRQ
jgi:integral membrane protein